MNDPNSGQTAPELPQAAIGGRRRFSLVWLIPIVAAIAGAWLVYTTFAERGPTITITLQAASGLEPGKTPIKYRDVQLGLVKSVMLSDDLQRVVVTARMEKAADKELREGTSSGSRAPASPPPASPAWARFCPAPTSACGRAPESRRGTSWRWKRRPCTKWTFPASA